MKFVLTLAIAGLIICGVPRDLNVQEANARFTPDGGYVFPLIREYNGLTLRDLYAGMAMQGQISFRGASVRDEPLRSLAKRSYRMADIMIAEKRRTER